MLATWVFAGTSAWGQAPSEVLVLVNRNHPDSIAIANAFVKTRGIPPINVVELDLPPSALAVNAKTSVTQFRDWIWTPANKAINERKLRDHVWAWMYSAGFPLHCAESPGLSLTGITFSRGMVPKPSAVSSGRAFSPLFAGPAQPDGPSSETASPAWTLAELGTNAPIPSMVLGHTGARGTRLDTALDVIHRGVDADFSHPKRAIAFFLTSKDIRSTCRAWQYPAVVEQLRAQQITALENPTPPSADSSIFGLQCGRTRVSEGGTYGFVPGAMAEHLTSFAGAFRVYHQSKLTYWLRKGATASSGTVVEPGAIWTKFPHARFFEHYAQGTSMLESFYLSVASPFQLLIMGEPLARPFADPLVAKWAPIDPDHPFTYRVEAPEAGPPLLCRFLLNGRPLTPLGHTTSISLSPAQWPDGAHELRADLSTKSPVRRHTQLSRTVRIGTHAVRLSCAGPVLLGHPVPLHLESSPSPSEVRILKGATELAVADEEHTGTVRLDSRRLGLGPSPLHAEARFPDGRTARSQVLWVEVIAPTEPLKIRSVRKRQTDAGQWTLEARLAGVDPVTPGTLTAFRPIEDDWIPDTAIGGQTVAHSKGTVSLTPGKKKRAILLIDGLASNRWESFTTTLGWKATAGVPQADTVGIVFNYRDPGHFDFFGMHLGAGWALLTRNGRDTVIHEEVGMPIFFGENYPLELEVQHPQGIVGRVAGQVVLRWPEGRLTAKPVGLIGSEEQPIEFTQLGMRAAQTPLTAPTTSLSVEGKRKSPLFLRAEQESRVNEESITLR